jgi:hypothetical protein
LHAVPETARQIVNEISRRASIAASKSPAGNELGIGIDGYPKPDVSSVRVRLGDLLDPGPHLVKLQAAAIEVLERFVLVIGAYLANFHEQTHHGFLRNAGHSDGGPDRASFDQAVNHLCSCVAG